MTKKPIPAAQPLRVNEVGLAKTLGDRYLAYALSTIMSRSLPDARDGLKPVHRRLLYAMRQLGLDPASGFKKCARIVGDVMGKYHPHGDAAIYDAMVRLAQDFAVRYPLVDGQGNFGNVDGDNAAAMRYTEARLTAVADALMEGLDENAIDFRQTYDGEDKEPIVFPAAFPNLLANGANGIAVGMATSIPPHNVAEICDALQHLIKTPKATTAKLVSFIKGPDFPTGGVLVEPAESILQAYEEGRGSFRLRARYTVENLPRNQYQIIVTEVPYQVPKARLIERMAALLEERKLPLLGDIRDESSDVVRLVLEPKTGTVPPEMLMESLFRATDLEVRVPLNMNVLDKGVTPRVMNLRDVLQAFLDHRHEVLVRRTRHRLERIAERLLVLDAYLAAYLNLDLVIKIIRNEDEPKPKMVKALKISEEQAEAILNMRLRSLRKLDEMEIRREHAALTTERRGLNALLKDEDGRWKKIGDEIAEIKTKFGPKTPLGKRRTEIGDAPEAIEIPEDAGIEKEDITVVCSEKGWIRSFKGHLGPDADIKYKEGDGPRFTLHASTTDKLVMFGSNGRFYTLAGDRLPAGRGHGEPVRLMVDLGNDDDIVGLFVHKAGRKLLVASSDGRGFIVNEDEVLAQTRGGKQALNVKDGVTARVAVPAEGDSVAVIGENRKLLVFGIDEVPEMARGRGVILQKYGDGGLADVKVFTKKQGLSWRQGDKEKVETDLRDWIGKRAQAGRLPPQGLARQKSFG
ncbi:MAG TPA: DNA topoisomerase IV subunit A [Alphaproteobacteria bacterium]|nr:DNA topoisomerase IV subunit A [Alphaproteobacteria bacterium]